MSELSRRQLLRNTALAGVGMTALPVWSVLADQKQGATPTTPLKGNVRHSVSRWTFGHLSIEQLCQQIKTLGFNAIDLVGPQDWPTLKKYGVEASMCNGAEISLEDGWVDADLHDELVSRYHDHIDLVADAGYSNLICFSGNARGLSARSGLDNMARGLARILPHAEKRNVTLFLELLNSKVDHPDYMADNSAWGVALCKRLNSTHFSLLYDIYHMQISEGDIIRTITTNSAYLGHYHTAGVPGRHEIDDSQELNYPAIVRAITQSGFQGYVAQEFIPTPESDAGKLASLDQAIRRCDV